MDHVFRNFSASIKPTLARLFIVMLLVEVALIQAPAQNVQAAPGDATLILTKTIDGDITTAEVGDTIFYRLRFACSSLTNDCGELEITDVLPTNPNPPFGPLFTYIPADSDVPAGFTMVEAPAGTITITKDDNLLLDGSQYDAVIAVRVNYDARPLPATITNQAVGLILPPGEPLWEAPVTATAPPLTIDGVTADWDLTKTLYSPSINPTLDTDVTYQVQLCPGTTSGNVALTNIQITDTLPAGADFVGASNGGTESGGVVTWNAAGSITPPNCVTRYVTVRYPSTLFESVSPPDDPLLIENVTNTATYIADYTPSSGTCASPCLGDTVPINHDIIDIVEGPTYNKDDVGDPVGWVGTARFTLELDTNGTNYPSNSVTLFDTLPAQLQVTGVTSGTWASDHVRATIEYATDYDGTPNWTAFPGQPVEYNDNDLYNTGLPTNITRVRWVFEYDSDPNDLNGDGDLAPLPGLPFDWTFSNSPEIRVTPRHTATTAGDGTPMPAAVVGATYTNCLQMSRINSGGTPLTGACNNETMTVQGDFVSLRTTKAETPGGSYDPVDDPLINTFVADGSILPNDTLRYVLTVDITERSSADLINPVIQDTLPAELIFVRNGTAQLDGVDVVPQPHFSQVGQVLTWAWTNNSTPLFSIPPLAPNPLTLSPLTLGSRYLTVSFYARVPRGTPPGDSYTNNLYVTTDSIDLFCEITGTHQTDDGDIDGDLNSTEDACKNTDTFRVERSAALRGEKWIRSVHADNNQVVRFNTFAPPAGTPADPACPNGGTAGLPGSANPFTRYPCISQAYPEGALGVTQYTEPLLPAVVDPTLDDYEYNVRIFNEGNVPMLEYFLYDILPYSTDKGSGGTLVNAARNSEFRPMLRGPVVFVSGTGVAAGNFLIEYSQSTNPCRPEVFDSVNPNTPAGCINDWTAVAPADWSTVRAYRIELISGSIPEAVPAGQEPRFGVPMFIPKDSIPLGIFNDDDAQSREIAWNSFSHVGAYDRDPDPAIQIQDLLASEPRKVGITIPERFSIGNRVWRDSDNSGTINAPDDANPGIAGVTVNLYVDADGNGTPDGAAIASTLTDVGGYYLFSNLPAGNYVVGIPASNFDNAANPLYTLHSSTGTPSSATYTNPPETNPDSSDHGIDTVVPPLPSTEVLSRSIPLAHVTELTNESDLSANNRDGPAGTRRGLNGERDENSDLTVDFGFFGGTDIPFSIGNHIWFDNGAGAGGTLNDGIRQSGEPLVAGARVDLYRDGNLDGILSPAELIRWDITDLQGFYLFDNLDPGSYYARVSAGNFTNSFDPDGAGPLPSAPGVLRGWYSSQPTGTENGGVAGNTNIPNTDSDDNGVNTDYPESQGVRSGVIVLTRGVDETLNETHLSGDSSTTLGFNPTAGDGTSHIGRFGETDATSNTTIDFGFIPPMSLGNRVWIDNGAGEATFRAGFNNGLMDGTETGVNGVRVELWRDTDGTAGLNTATDTFIRFTTTDAQGYYLFDRTQPGNNYYVHIPASNFTGSGALLNYISSYDSVQTTPPADDTEDKDDNGLDNGNNPAANGVTSPLITMAYTTEPTTETDLSPDTTTYGTNNVGLFGQANNDSNLTMDFGFVRPPRSIGNYLWFDIGGGAGVVNDGIRNGTEGPVANARVSLYRDADANGQPDDLGVVGNRTDDWIAWDTTDANGYYLFDNLPPANYLVGVDRDNFATGVLVGYTSSTGNVDNATNDLDSRDNGVNRPALTDATLSPHGILSTRIDLTAIPITLPSGETFLSGQADPGAPTNDDFNPTGWDGDSDLVTPGIQGSRGRYGETDANSDLTIDFGFVNAYSIGNRIWFDTNNNAIMDAGEVGVDGVQVEIYQAAVTLPTGTVIDTQVTANGGYYLFDHLPPGNYVVVVTADNFNSTGTYNALVGYWSSLTYRDPLNSGNIAETAALDPDLAQGVPGPSDDDIDLDDNGFRRTTGGAPFQNAVLALPVTVGPTGLTEPLNETDLDATLPGSQQGQPDGRGNMKVDFGFYRTEIGNLVFEDVNLNGTYNAGTDNLMNGARVGLYQQNNNTEVRVGPDGILGTADDATNGVLTGPNAQHPAWGNGEYHFSGLPAGDYIVRVTAIPAAFPNMISTIDTFNQADNDNPDVNIDNNDNGDGIGTVTAPGNVTSDLVNRLTTNPGSTGAQSNNVVTQSTGTTTDNTVDFGFVKSYSLGNRVWYDTNNNGVRDAAEVGINGVRVELYRDTDGNGSYTPGTDAFVGFTTTATNGTNGYYRFDNLFPGDYVVVLPGDNFRNVGVGDTVAGDPLRSYWSTGTTINASGTAIESATNDPDNNFDASTVVASSDDNGATTFIGNTTNYVASTAITLGGEVEPLTDNDPATNPQGGESPNNRSNRTVDFGFYREEIGNLVFSDNDVSGHFNAGDTAINSALVHLFASNGTTEIITGGDGILGTADDLLGPDGAVGGGDDGTGGVRTGPLAVAHPAWAAGTYLFSGLPAGDYIVKVDSPAGMVSTIDTNPQADNDNPNTNTDNNDNGDGVTGGAVTFDASDSLTMNPGVDALKPNRTVTNASGTTTDPTIDFGFVSLMGIGNRVWIDDGAGNFANANNGRLDAGEVGVNNVTVQLFSTGPDGLMGGGDDYQVGSDTATASIGANAGYYQFDNLYPSRYYVRIPASEFNAGGDLVGYTSSFGNGGLNDDDDQSGASGDENGIDSTSLTVNGIVTPVYTLMPNTEPTTDEHAGIYTGTLSNNNVNFTADFGFFYPFSIGNRVFRDNGAGGGVVNINNGIMDGTELPIANVRVELWQDTNGTAGLQVSGATPDNFIRYDTTDAGGYYLFDGLNFGEYYVHVPANNFTGAGALVGLYNSTPTGTEGVGVPGNNLVHTPDTDADDNGVNDARPDLNGISSGPIVLSRATEPTGETELSSDTGSVAGNNPTVDDGPSSRGRNTETDDDSNLTVDFGFIPPLSLGNRVWIDNGSTATGPILSQYNDALMNGNEPGRNAVALNLYYDANDDGIYTGGETTPYATTATDANGYYLFDKLPPGRFYVQVAPSNFASGGALEGFSSSTGQSLSEILDINDNGIDDVNYLTNGISSVNFILNNGVEPIIETDLNTTGTYGPNNVGNFGQTNADSNLTLDFGFVSPPRSLGNRLWFDDNNNGVMDGGEAPVVNAHVSLYSDNNNDGVPDGAALATDITDTITTPGTGGFYLFDNLPSGRYLVGVDYTNFQSGQPLFEYANSTGNQTNGTDVNDNGIDRILPGDATASPYGVLSNTVDLTVPAPTGETDLSGNPADGSIGESRGTNGETDANSDLTIDFGFHIPMSIGNRVWRDDGGTTGIKNNGIMDGNEAPISGVRVELYRDTDGTAGLNIATDTFVRHDVTDTNGYFLFDDLVAGNYFVHVPLSNFAPAGTLFGLNNSNPTGAEDTGVAGNPYTPNTDRDDNGVNNTRPDQNGISSGVIVLALTTEPQNETELSGQANPGAPNNAANNPTGWDGPNSRGRFGEADNNSNLTVDFGFLPVYSLGNRVWLDSGAGGGTAADGIINGTEPGISGVTVNLYLDSNNDGIPDDINIIGNPTDDVLATDTTDGNGYYRFDNLIADTYIVEVAPSASTVGLGSTADFTLDANDNVDNDDNGVIILPTGEVRSHPITLGGALEPTTDNDAAPNPNLADGEAPNNQSNRTVDFGFVGAVAIGNVVWFDTGAGAAYNNGIFDAGETGVNGVTVNLYYDVDDSGAFTGGELTAYRSTVTAGGGFYQFDRLIPGRYYVGIPNAEFLGTEQLVGYISSTDDIPATTDQTIDNNADENGRDMTSTILTTNGIRTIEYVLAVNTMPTTDNDTEPGGSYTGTIADNGVNFTADFGFTQVVAIGNRVWFDNGAAVGQANNGRQDTGESGVNNVRVELYQSGATPGVTTPIATTTTNASGDYVFDGLMPDNYFVHIPAVEFQAGGNLFSYSSSTGQGTNDDDQTLDENGSDSEPSVNGVSSPVYNLTLNGEPVASDDETGYPGVLDDNDINFTADFGFVQLVAIGNVVWLDTGAGAAYNNGVFDAGESGVDGVTVNLYTSTGTFVATRTTAGGGYYEFDNLFPGIYYVEIPAAEFLPGGDLVGYTSSTGSGTDAADDDDTDENGQDNNTLLTSGIRTMPYILTAGGLPTTSDDETSYNGNLDDNSVNFTADLGFTEAYSLGNRVWYDADKDGTRNGTETGLPNVPVNLYRDSNGDGTPDGGIIASALTDVSGFYRFDNLIADTYIVEVVPPLGYASTVDAGDADTDTDDDDDNGVNFVGSNVRSEPVTLGRGNSEPVSETNPALNPDAANGEAPDARSNRTVDFGFIVSTLVSDKQLTGTIVMDTDPATGNPIAGTDFTSGTQVAIGEILTYHTRLQVPSGSTLTTLVAVDQLDAGLAFVGCDSITAPNLTTTLASFNDACNPDTNPTVAPQSTPEGQTDANLITFSLGNVNNSTADTQTITITYRVIVLDVPGNQDGVSGLNNSVAWSWGGTNLTPVQATPVEVVEPDLSINKSSTPSSAPYGRNIQFTIDVAHTSASSTDAFDVTVTDQIPAGLTIAPSSIVVSGTASTPGNFTSNFDTVTNTLTVTWDVFRLGETGRITFSAIFVGPAPVTNTANVEWSSLPIDPQPDPITGRLVAVPLSPFNSFSTERWYDPTDRTGLNPYGRADAVTVTLPDGRVKENPWTLPATGFAPNVATELPAMPAGFAYAQTDILLEIPRIKQSMKIAGVPYDNEKREWNLTWLNNEAGWLENTAYPTHAGNSALTAHTTLPNGQPGPFASLDTLSYGDQVIVRFGGQKYIFEVRDNKRVKPSEVNSTLKHEEYPWLTLITCKSYNEKTGDYTYRTVVRAVLVKVVDE